MYILAVDDERFALERLTGELEKVFPTAKLHGEMAAKRAIAWAENLAEEGKSLSYAFLDIQMRFMNGLELAKELKSIHPGVTLFFCTAYSEYAYDAILSSNVALRFVCRAQLLTGGYTQQQAAEFIALSVSKKERAERQAKHLFQMYADIKGE